MKSKTEFNTQNQGDSIYLVTVTETLTRTFQVKADNENEAKRIVEKEYEDGNIVLDYDDFNDVEFKTRKVTNECLDLYEEITED